MIYLLELYRDHISFYSKIKVCVCWWKYSYLCSPFISVRMESLFLAFYVHLYVSLLVNGVSCKENIDKSFLKIYSTALSLLITNISPFSFKVLFSKWGLDSVIFSITLWSHGISLFLTLFSLVVWWSSTVIKFDSIPSFICTSPLPVSFILSCISMMTTLTLLPLHLGHP